MYNDYTYIVTGCTGYVGNVITKKLLEDGCKVIGFARNNNKADRVFPVKKPEFVFGDIKNKQDIKKLFQNADENYVVIHTVAKVSIGEASKQELLDITVKGTENVVEQCVNKKINKLLHISSTEAIPHNIELKEDLSNYVPDPKNSREGYSRAKSMADKVVFDAVKNNGLKASIILLAGVLGPGDYSNSHMSQMFINYIEGKLPASIKGGYNDFDIRDVTNVLPAIIDKSKSGESYLFANKPDKINDILKVISKKTGAKRIITLPLWTAYVGLPFLWLGSKLTGKRPLYTSSALASLKADADFPISKVANEFGYNPRPLSETVADHVDFLIENGMTKI